MTLRIRFAAVVVSLGLAAGLAGCGGTTTSLGAVTEIGVADRGAPISLTGTDLDGKPVDISTYRGLPLVVVVWGAWCGDCRAEAADVTAVANQLDGKAHFLGVDIRDASRAQAQAYVRQYKTPFPSVYSDDAEALLSFPGKLSPRTVPEFAVLDAQGRVAATIVGQLPSKLTLVQVVQDVTGSAGTGT